MNTRASYSDYIIRRLFTLLLVFAAVIVITKNLHSQQYKKKHGIKIVVRKAVKGTTNLKGQSEVSEDEKLELDKDKNKRYVKARKLLLSRQYSSLARELSALKRKHPVEQDREYHFYKGVVYEKRKYYRKAVECYLQAVELSPDYSKARNSLGCLYCKLHKYHLAEEHFLEAIQANVYNPFINYNLGNLYFDIGDYDKSYKYITNAIEYKKNFGSAYHKLAIILFINKDYLNSFRTFKQAIKFKKKSHTTYYYMGMASFHLGKGSTSIYYLKRAIKMKSNFFEASLELGKIYQAYGEYENALKFYHRSRILNPDYDEISLLMVECYKELRRYTDAINIIKDLLKKDPENKKLKKYLTNLQNKRLTENLTEPYDYYTY